MELYYGISLPENCHDEEKVDIKKFYTDKSEVMKILKQVKGTRFRVFKSQAEAEDFSQCSVPAVLVTPSDPTPLSSPKPSDKCEFKSLKPQEEVQFRKAIEKSPSSDLESMMECIEENARYLVTPSDTPTILHQGPRHNAVHVAAKHGRLEAARLVLSHVTGGLMARMYPTECPVQNQRRREHLVDMYLNMPDKGGGDTPLHLAAKFGRSELVHFLCSFHQTRLDQLNRNGETALAVVCSRAGDDKKKEEITAVISGQLVIPVYSAEDTKQLGRPISLKQAADLLDTSGSEHHHSSHSLSNSPLVQSSRARVTLTPDTRSPMGMSPMVNSPLVNSPSVNSPMMRSPMMRSPMVNSPQVGTISAVLGPVPACQAERLYRTWKVSPARERLEDPALGLERQGRQLAGREGVEWVEFWPWLGEYVDLTSQLGLDMLENHLEEKMREAREIIDRENQDELVDELEASLVITKGSGREEIMTDIVSGEGELEIVSKQSSVTPARLDNWSKHRDSVFLSCDDNRSSDNNANNSLSQPLSPLSSLMNGLDSLKLDNQKPESENDVILCLNQDETWTYIPRPSSSLQSSAVPSEVRRSLEQFVCEVVSRLAESLPGEELTDLTEWLLPVTSHWTQLRRQVNNWRSDPQGRWRDLHWGSLAVSLVEMMRDQVSLELGTGLERDNFAQILGSVASVAEVDTASEEEDQDDKYKRGRRTERSRDSGLSEISLLCSLVSKSLLDPELSLTVRECEELWDVVSVRDNSCVTTSNVNRARRFLHSSSSGQGRARRDSGSSQESQEEDWGTPPSSPGGSLASMQTCAEPAVVWVVGDSPSNQDRRVAETLKVLPPEQLARFPSISQYLSQLNSVSRDAQLAWRDPYCKPSAKNKFGGLAMKLDLDVTF